MEHVKEGSNDRGKLFRIFFLLLLFGILNLLSIWSSPTWGTIRGVDAVRLIGTGMCFGSAVVIFAAYIRNRRLS